MFLLSFGLVFVVWCVLGLAGIVLGFFQPPRPAATVRYALFHIGFFYVPMMATGWKVLGHNRVALWVGTLVAFAFFIRIFVFGVIWTDWLGQPLVIDAGGLYENPADVNRVLGDLIFTTAGAILCVYCVAALLASYANPRSSFPADHLRETVKIPMKGETGKTDKEG